MKLKKSIVTVWLTIIFNGIAYLFWQNEFVYCLPAPVPRNYKMVNCGDKIIIPQIAQSSNNSPLLFLRPIWVCKCRTWRALDFLEI